MYRCIMPKSVSVPQFYAGVRAEKGIDRTSFPLKLTDKERRHLAKLSRARKQSASAVLRELIMAAS